MGICTKLKKSIYVVSSYYCYYYWHQQYKKATPKTYCLFIHKPHAITRYRTQTTRRFQNIKSTYIGQHNRLRSLDILCIQCFTNARAWTTVVTYVRMHQMILVSKNYFAHKIWINSVLFRIIIWINSLFKTKRYMVRFYSNRVYICQNK